MPLKRRVRRLDDSLYGAPVYDKLTNTELRSAADFVWKGIQFTESEGHGKSRDGKYHEGGPFFTVSVRPDIHYRNVKLETPHKGALAVYKGPIVVGFVPQTFGNHFSAKPIADIEAISDNSFLDPLGATAISIVDPMDPNANTGTALGEIIRDRRLPIPGVQAWRQRTEVARAAGSEYLNAVFGWLPLVSDVLDTAQSVMDIGTILENYHSNSGSDVHREFEFPHEEETTETIYANGQAEILTGGTISSFVASSVPITKRSEKTVRRWFSGKFTYQAAGGNKLRDLIRLRTDAEKLFGTTLTPDLLWELTPWSWAIDWFSNTSNVIHNIQAFVLSGLVMRYGYIMEETTIVDTYSMPETGLKGLTGSLPPSTITYNVKRRRDANPFGFGVEWEGLSPSQLAITAALGITRLR